jgi:hypothetical protein
MTDADWEERAARAWTSFGSPDSGSPGEAESVARIERLAAELARRYPAGQLAAECRFAR